MKDQNLIKEYNNLVNSVKEIEDKIINLKNLSA